MQPLWKTIWSVLKQSKDKATILSSNLTPGYISGENNNSRRYIHPDVHCRTIYNNQDMKQPKYSLAAEWIKMWYIYTVKYYSAIKQS